MEWIKASCVAALVVGLSGCNATEDFLAKETVTNNTTKHCMITRAGNEATTLLANNHQRQHCDDTADRKYQDIVSNRVTRNRDIVAQ